MTHAPAPEKKPRRAWFVTLALLLPVMLLAACSTSKPERYVHQYMLEYTAPQAAVGEMLPTAVQVTSFTGAPGSDTQQMVYEPERYERGAYSYHQWRAAPGPMVAEALRRDLLASRRFLAVLGPDSLQQGRFLLEGGVLSFLEVDQGSEVKARLAVVITLLDKQRQDLYQRVLFQKTYRAEATMSAKSGPALVQAMSQAMARISPQVTKDIYQAVKKRLDQPPPDKDNQ